MSLRRDLRQRVAVGIAALVVVAVAAHSIFLLSAFEQLEVALIDTVVGEELQRFIAHSRNAPARTPEVSERMTAYLARDAASRAALPAYLRDLPPGLHEIRIGDREHHAAIRDEPEGRFYMLYDVSAHDEREQRFVMVLVAGTVATLLAAVALGYWAAGRLVRPVHELARRVQDLGAGQPATPLAHGFVDEDVKGLAAAFDGYLEKVAVFIRREQEFTANVSHELRTPLTSIGTSCELLLQEATLSDAGRRRVQAIGRAAERLTSAADSLLFLARGGEPPRMEEVCIRECVEDAAEPVRNLLQGKGVAFEMAVHPTAVVCTDWHALYLVASNLIRNAASYTDRGAVRIDYRDGRLSFEDSGPGIDPEELPRVFDRHYRGDASAGRDGCGLGLAIVRRICESFGWRLEIASTRERGTRVTVRFPLGPPERSPVPPAA